MEKLIIHLLSESVVEFVFIFVLIVFQEFDFKIKRYLLFIGARRFFAWFILLFIGAENFDCQLVRLRNEQINWFEATPLARVDSFSHFLIFQTDNRFLAKLKIFQRCWRVLFRLWWNSRGISWRSRELLEKILSFHSSPKKRLKPGGDWLITPNLTLKIS